MQYLIRFYWPCLVLTMLLWTSSAFGGEPLDIGAELSQPGVKLVVVEFYATWCEPCMKAVPEWKELQAKYADKGLRFVVVSAENEDLCSSPPDWTPDRTFCDKGGAIRREFGIESLPTSLLFSWDGRQKAVRQHEVAPVREAIEHYLTQTNPRINVDKNVEVLGDGLAISSNETWVREYVIGKILAQSKFEVTDKEELPGGSLCKSEASDPFPANSTLHIALQGDERGNRAIRIKLNKGACTLASVEAPYTGVGLEEDQASLRLAASKVVKDLVEQWIGVHSKAEVVELSQAERKLRELDVSLPPPDPKLGFGHLYVFSTPPGAIITLNKQTTEFKTPHLFEDLAVGNYAVKVESGEAVGGGIVQVKPNEAMRLVIEMKSQVAKQGSLMVETEPALLRVYVDGVFRGRAPLFVPTISAGAHEISASGWGDGTIWQTETRAVAVQASIRNRYTLHAYDAIMERRTRASFQARFSGGLELRKATKGVAGLAQIGVGTCKWLDIFSGVGFPGYVWVTDFDVNLYPYGRFVPTLTSQNSSRENKRLVS